MPCRVWRHRRHMSTSTPPPPTQLPLLLLNHHQRLSHERDPSWPKIHFPSPLLHPTLVHRYPHRARGRFRLAWAHPRTSRRLVPPYGMESLDHLQSSQQLFANHHPLRLPWWQLIPTPQTVLWLAPEQPKSLDKSNHRLLRAVRPLATRFLIVVTPHPLSLQRWQLIPPPQAWLWPVLDQPQLLRSHGSRQPQAVLRLRTHPLRLRWLPDAHLPGRTPPLYHR